jgi:predicted ATPase/DNA-binding CsgD family transcriptional regulator
MFATPNRTNSRLTPLIPFSGRHPTVQLPQPPTPLIGREREIAAVVDRLARGDVRLISLTGPGGVGKTRLAIRVAAELEKSFRDGVAFVPLASVTDASLVPSAIAQTLQVREGSNTPFVEALATALHDRQMLLLLDNFEHLLAAGTVIAELLATASGLSILITSRARLGLLAEHEFPVGPLPVPDLTAALEKERVRHSDAVRLFVTRAQALRPDFTLTSENAAAVASICVRLDGLPLAIELAAARISHLPPAALLARLDRRLPLLTGGPRDQPARLQTMRDAIGWSYGLLSPQEQALFRALSVFAGGFTLEAAESVRNAGGGGTSVLDLIASLVGQSLVQQIAEVGGEPRYTMLETIREYGWDELIAAGEVEEARRRHAKYFLDFAAFHAARLGGRQMAESLAWLSAELPNLRAALTLTLEQGDAKTVLRLAAALYPFWSYRGHFSEGRRWLEAALAAGSAGPISRSDGLLAITGLAALQGDNSLAKAVGEEALALAREEGYAFGEFRALYLLGIAAEWRGDIELAATHFRETLRLRDQVMEAHWIARSLMSLADLLQVQGDLDQSYALAEEALAMARQVGHAWTEAEALGVLTHVAVEQGDYAAAVRLCRETLDVSQTLGDQRGVAGVLGALAGLFLAAGQPRRATHLLAAARTLADSIGLGFIAHHVYAEQVRATACGRLTEQAFADAWAEGRALPPEQAIADALEEANRIVRKAEEESRKQFDLTSRELEVLRLIALGHSDREIGEALFISHRTANAHVGHIFAKLGIHTRAEAAAEAVRRGLW